MDGAVSRDAGSQILSRTRGGPASQTALPRVEVRALLGGSREIIVVHKEAEYRLRLTSNDKLILTK
jgi:hemin uptake protein HemP